MEVFLKLFLVAWASIIVIIFLFGCCVCVKMAKDDKEKTEIGLECDDSFQCFGKNDLSKSEANMILRNIMKEDKKRERMRRYWRR